MLKFKVAPNVNDRFQTNISALAHVVLGEIKSHNLLSSCTREIYGKASI